VNFFFFGADIIFPFQIHFSPLAFGFDKSVIGAFERGLKGLLACEWQLSDSAKRIQQSNWVLRA